MMSSSSCAAPLSQNHDALRASVASFARRRIDDRSNDREGCIPRALLTELAELGLFGLTLPEAYGGTGLSLCDAVPVIEELAFFDRSVAVTVGLHLGLGTRGLVLNGTKEQKARYLPALAEGKMIAAFAATEPGAGSDLMAVQSLLRCSGDRIQVSGTKCYVTNAHLAGVFTVLTRTSPNRSGASGFSLVLLERSDPGFSVDAEERKLGLRASSTAGLALDAIDLPKTRILGEAGQAALILDPVLATGRTLMAAGCVGAARRAVELLRVHLGRRRQFGRPLGALPVVRAQFGRLLCELAAVETAVSEAANAESDPIRFRELSLIAKVFASETACRIVDTALQLHGGFGYMEESGLPVLLRDIRITRIFEGANEVLLQRIGALMVTQSNASSTSTLSVAEQASADLASRLQADLATLRAEAATARLGGPQILERIGRLAVLASVTGAMDRRAKRTVDSQAALFARGFAQIAAAQAEPLTSRETDLVSTIGALALQEEVAA